MGTELSFNYTIPELIVGKFDVSEIYQNYNARGNPTSFGVDLDFSEICLTKTLKSTDFHMLRGKIEATLLSWTDKYQRYLDKQHKEMRSSSVEEMNNEAKEAIEDLHNILTHTLNVDDAVDWDTYKRKDAFRIKPEKLVEGNEVPSFVKFNTFGRPTEFEEATELERPIFEKVLNEYGFFSKLFRANAIKKGFEERVKRWYEEVEKVKNENIKRKENYNVILLDFEKKKEEFENDKQRDNEALEEMKVRYQNCEPKGIEEYCDLVLNNSQYPDYFPKNWELEYNGDSKIVVVDSYLPAPNQLPTIESYKYVKSRDEITKKHLKDSAIKNIYESVLYQFCIRTIHELFEADVVNALDSVAFNGLVTNVNPATGIKETKTIISIMSNKADFIEFDLSKVDPKATFKHLKGVAATALIDLTPIPPVIKLDKHDKRFIEGKEIVAGLNESVNLAAMSWEDFEHLIRELFENEFTTNGGEVKVTQASSDGGVDAIAYDPDPIRGGKIVIQAKRYTNTVGVAAVRDLYGTVMNEGATKGILVTTSSYGKDSYDFAKDKPITLLNGSNLLSLLEKHGHKARINIAEAKKLI